MHESLLFFLAKKRFSIIKENIVNVTKVATSEIKHIKNNISYKTLHKKLKDKKMFLCQLYTLPPVVLMSSCWMILGKFLKLAVRNIWFLFKKETLE